MTSVNAVVDTVTSKVVTDNVETVGYAVAGFVVYYLIAPHLAPYLAKVPLVKDIPLEFQPVLVSIVVVGAGYFMKSKEVMALGSGMAVSGLIMSLAPKAISAISGGKN